MKIAIKLSLVCLGALMLWLTVPFGLTTYINQKYSPHVNIESISLFRGGIDCIRLNNIKLNSFETKGISVSGIVNNAVACYYKRTVDIDGGKLKATFISSKSEKKQNTSSGLNVSGKKLELHITKGNISADLFEVVFNEKDLCAGKVFATHQKADVVVFDICYDLHTNNVRASKGTITPSIEIKGHQIQEISFTALTKITRNELVVGTVKYEENIATNVHAKIDGDLAYFSIGYLSLSNKKLFNSTLGFKNVDVSSISTSDPLSSKITIGINNTVSVIVDIEKRKISGKDSCSNWLSVVPEELKTGPISQMHVKGTFGFDVQFSPVSLKINSTCSIDGPTPQFILDLSKPFKYTVYHPDGTPFERTAGPGTMDWIPLDFVDNMATALTITEDPGFWHHRGIIPQALENSLKDDLRLGRFFRGGSTITMQLAKNLWLNRSRTLGRKLQEGILTIALESCLTKEKILELYLNVIEFGPNTYGIGPGCAKFLRKYPGEITISEALYMATRLPSPNKAHSYEANKGFIRKLIAIGVASGKISEEELQNELQAQQYKEQLDDSDDDVEVNL